MDLCSRQMSCSAEIHSHIRVFFGEIWSNKTCFYSLCIILFLLHIFHYFNLCLILWGYWCLYLLHHPKGKKNCFLLESESHSIVSNSLWPYRLHSPRNSLGQNTGVDSLSFLQGISPTRGLNPGLPHCGQIFTSWATREAQEYWSGQPIPSWEDLPNPGIEPESPVLQVDSLSTE